MEHLPCATGCRQRDQHQADCAREECRGCQPREATRGVLCDRCYASLAANLAGIPILMHHLREIARLDTIARARPLSSDPVCHGDPAHGTVLPAAALCADELWSLVTGWAHVILEEHPMTLRGPNSRPWHGDVIAWMVPHLEWIVRQDWAPDLKRELARDVSTLRARWPLPDDAERDRDVPGVRCPRVGCGAMALRYYPPSVFRQPFAVACGECGRTFDEREWGAFVDAYQRDETRAEMIAAAEAEAARRERMSA